MTEAAGEDGSPSALHLVLAGGPAPLELSWADHGGAPTLVIRGWSGAAAQPDHRLSVFPTDVLETGADPLSLQPIAGSLVPMDGAVRFVPRFPFVAGARYTVVAEAFGVETHRVSILRPDSTAASTTLVTAIEPSAATIPVNLLRMYVHFSAPMSEGFADRAIQMLRADTRQPLANVFVPMGPELWDRDRRRLTLLLDPARIKRGLVANRESGYPLIEGVDVILCIDADYRDAQGRVLREAAQRRYSVGPELRGRVDPRGWELSMPAAHTQGPLDIRFGRSLDHGLLEHCLSIRDSTGGPVSGALHIGAEERSASFWPDAPWLPSNYQLVIEPILEDVAGNSAARVFDRDLRERNDDPADARVIGIPFVCLEQT
jgi:hypothetical protein